MVQFWHATDSIQIATIEIRAAVDDYVSTYYSTVNKQVEKATDVLMTVKTGRLLAGCNLVGWKVRRIVSGHVEKGEVIMILQE